MHKKLYKSGNIFTRLIDKCRQKQISEAEKKSLQKEKELMKDIEEIQHNDLRVLKDINLQIKSGEFLGVIGSVAAGKSSLIHAIIGEIDKLKGSVRLNGKLAYIPQTVIFVNNRKFF